MATPPNDALNLLLGAGGAAFLTAVYKAYKDIREGTWKRRDNAVADLERWRDENDSKRHTAETREDAWRAFAGDCEHLLRVNGIEIPPSKPANIAEDRAR